MSDTGTGASTRSGPSPRAVLAAMTASLAMVFIDQTVVAVALPSIRGDLDLGSADFQWVVNGYLLTVASLAIAGGRLSDILGHPRGAALAMATFVGGSILSGAAQSPEWLIASRVVQGAGAAMLTSSTVAIVSDAYPEAHRGKALGIYWGVAGLALSLGPLLGGALTEALSWRWIFWVNPLIALALMPTMIGLIRATPRERREPGVPRPRIDLAGTALLAIGLGVLVGGLHDFAPLLLLVGAVAIAAFVAVERRRSEPLLDLALFRDRPIVAALLVIALTQAVVVWGAIFLADYMQVSLGYSPSKAGFVLLPATLMLLVGSILGGRITDKAGPRLPGLLGCIGAIAGLVWLTLVIGRQEYLILLPGLLLFGLSLSVAQSPMTVAVMNRVTSDQRAAASGLLGTCRQIGGAIGLAVLSGIIAADRDDKGLAGAMEPALLAGAGFVALGLTALLVLMPARTEG